MTSLYPCIILLSPRLPYFKFLSFITGRYMSMIDKWNLLAPSINITWNPSKRTFTTYNQLAAYKFFCTKSRLTSYNRLGGFCLEKSLQFHDSPSQNEREDQSIKACDLHGHSVAPADLSFSSWLSMKRATDQTRRYNREYRLM